MVGDFLVSRNDLHYSRAFRLLFLRWMRNLTILNSAHGVFWVKAHLSVQSNVSCNDIMHSAVVPDLLYNKSMV